MKKNNKWIGSILTILFAMIFLYGAFQLFGIWQEYRSGDVLYGDAQEEFLEVVPEEPQKDDSPKFTVDFESLHAINEDVAGWIWMKDTVVNYPVLHSKVNNDEYIYTTYDRKSNNSGSIFIDYRNSSGYTDDNTVIHGHNMKNGKMFAVLKRLRNQEFYDNHKEFYIMTPDGNRRYEIISVFQVDALSDLYDRQFTSADEKQNWLYRVLRSSAILSPFTTDVNDHFVMLSTCVSGEDERARIVAVARLAEIEPCYQPPEVAEEDYSDEETE